MLKAVSCQNGGLARHTCVFELQTKTVPIRDVLSVIDDVALASRLGRGIVEQRLDVAVLFVPLALADVVREDTFAVIAAARTAEVGRALKRQRAAGIVTVMLDADAGTAASAIDRSSLRLSLPRRATTQAVLWAAGALDRPLTVRLSEREHAAVQLFVVGNSIAAVGEIMGVGPETVRTLLRRGRAKLAAAGYACSTRFELAQAVHDIAAD